MRAGSKTKREVSASQKELSWLYMPTHEYAQPYIVYAHKHAHMLI